MSVLSFPTQIFPVLSYFGKVFIGSTYDCLCCQLQHCGSLLPPQHQGAAGPSAQPPQHQGAAGPSAQPPQHQGAAGPSAQPPQHQGAAAPSAQPPQHQWAAGPSAQPPQQSVTGQQVKTFIRV